MRFSLNGYMTHLSRHGMPPGTSGRQTAGAPWGRSLSHIQHQNHLLPSPLPERGRGKVPARNSHGHLKLLHPLPLHVLRLAEELKALLSLEVNQVEAIGPLGGQRHAGSWHGFVGTGAFWQLAWFWILPGVHKFFHWLSVCICMCLCIACSCVYTHTLLPGCMPVCACILPHVRKRVLCALP